jgi:hypothetical protein
METNEKDCTSSANKYTTGLVDIYRLSFLLFLAAAAVGTHKTERGLFDV